MAHKSKTQRAKASAARAARKEAREREDSKPEVEAAVAETPKKRFFGRGKSEDASKGASAAAASKTSKKAAEPAKKKKKKGFFSNVRSEMKRVTWPTKQDVLRWSVVVVCALLFFGICVAVLDNLIITPVLVGISGFGA
ncbi:MAG: preprotein translocase subunit SecE [Eggerthellaceae bacterium]|nr:preprotein translocase subunit SecE [Eggerthellaceae bacterium]